MKRTVFISHSSKDKAIGDEVCRFLEAHGVSCRIAPRDVTPGKNYGAAIVDAIDECAVFVLILSDDSNKSGQVVREVERAASTDSIIIPFRVIRFNRRGTWSFTSAHRTGSMRHRSRSRRISANYSRPSRIGRRAALRNENKPRCQPLPRL